MTVHARRSFNELSWSAAQSAKSSALAQTWHSIARTYRPSAEKKSRHGHPARDDDALLRDTSLAAVNDAARSTVRAMPLAAPSPTCSSKELPRTVYARTQRELDARYAQLASAAKPLGEPLRRAERCKRPTPVAKKRVIITTELTPRSRARRLLRGPFLLRAHSAP